MVNLICKIANFMGIRFCFKTKNGYISNKGLFKTVQEMSVTELNARDVTAQIVALHQSKLNHEWKNDRL